jgi:hypothetical protein
MFLLLIVPATAAQNPQPQREAVLSEITVRGTVEAVDHTSRTVKIRGQQGNVVTLDVPESYTRFDQVKVGDVVTITYYDRVSLKLKAPGEGPVDRVSPPTTTPTPGLAPGGTRAYERVTTATIDSWDPVTRILVFTTVNGQYTRRVVETLDPSVMAGLKAGDRVDVTRTEATNISVASPAPPQTATTVPDTFRHRSTVSVLWGPDNTFSGTMAQTGSGTYQGTPVTFNNTEYDAVYGTIPLLKIGYGYRMSPRDELNVNFVYSDSGSQDVQIGTIGPAAAPLTAHFGDLQYWGFEAGQRFFFARVRFTPFVGYTVSLNRYSDISATFSSPPVATQPIYNISAGDATQFFGSSWAVGVGGTGGFLIGVGPIEFMFESGLRYTGGLANLAPLAETTLGPINDNSSRWSVPALFGVRLRF